MILGSQLQVVFRLSRLTRTNMPVTRSATRASTTVSVADAGDAVLPKPSKRKALAAAKAPRKKARANAEPEEQATSSEPAPTAPVLSVIPPPGTPPAVVPATLSFSFEDAKEHLIEADERFQDLFERMQCKPYQVLDQVEPFRTLATSILSQQISWMAARSICHRFIRLYNPSLPEKPTDESLDAIKAAEAFFPTPQQVAATDIAILKTAGLSTRKAEYVSDLAARFADGRLSTEKLVQAEDEELYELLTAVRGIGRWTVDMFAIFSLRRPNILPVGDLGVQRGMCLWFLSLHAPHHAIIVSPEKPSAKPKSKPKKGKKAAADPGASESLVSTEIPSTPKKNSSALNEDVVEQEETPLATSSSAMEIPPAFTPSIAKTLNKEMSKPPPALPDGLTASVLKSRLDGKKVKGAILTPKEMEELTEHWKPYRSLAVYYMWSTAKAE